MVKDATYRACTAGTPLKSAEKHRPRGLNVTGRRQRSSTKDTERGSASALAIAIIAVTLTVALALITVAQARVLRHQAQAAADAAALAGAMKILVGVSEVCEQAMAIANKNGAKVERCSVEGTTVIVSVSTSNPRVLPGLMVAQAKARAGPIAGM